ncbi:MAG: class I tRNA ligase family protein, partial [Candidatus Dormibacteria bacterium]
RAAMELADRWILSRLQAVTAATDQDMARFDLGAVINRLYEFAWHEVADWYLELAKPRLEAGDQVARWVSREVLLQTLLLLHPIMPFLTDSLAEQFAGTPATLDLQDWPEVVTRHRDPAAEAAMAACRELISGLRHWLQDLGVPGARGGGRVAFAVEQAGPELGQPECLRYVSILAGVDWVAGRPGGAQLVLGQTRLRLAAQGVPGTERWRDPVQRRLADLERQLEALERKLATPFAQLAPEPVVAAARERLVDLQRRRALLRSVLES